MAFSPVEASQNIKEKYYRYLKTFFKPGFPYDEEFKKLIDDDDAFASGPYLDVTDAFTKGKSISSLIKEGILPESFSKINMNLDRPLYLHQEKAIRKIATEGSNLVVSTGTGSGKTESFLIPVLRQLVQEHEAGTLCPGVRTLLIYPMNALANDQTERLRGLLKDFPEITFGVYTGQTKQSDSDALAEYKSLNNNENPIPNELISRDRMIDTPPHILITNYAMLEYLMLRPKDSVFFDGDDAQFWKFIVFDEAHVYGGSTGIEVSMLFRRLKAKLNNQKITYILTSATLGDKEDDEKVAEFASNLCNAPFSSNDIVRAFRITPEATQITETIPLSFYKKISKLKNEDCSECEIKAALGFESDSSVEEALYNIIVNDKNYWKIRTILQKPQTVKYISAAMNWSEKELTDFVTVATMAEKDGGKLFDARYHMFIRAADSAFITLAPDNRIMLDRCKYRTNEQTGDDYKVFETAVCSYCNAMYLVGKIENNCLEQSSSAIDAEEKALFLLSEKFYDTDSDHTLEDEGVDVEPYYICPYCGFIKAENSNLNCEHGSGDYVKIFRVNVNNESRTLTKCPHCENTKSTGVLRMFFSGQEASTSVIGTALFEELPSYKITTEFKTETQTDEYDFGFDADVVDSQKNKETVAKQFIAFSDSRQAAAFYASYLNISYNNILYKRLIIEELKNLKVPANVPDFADKLHNLFNKKNVYGKSALKASSDYTVEKEAWKAILAELTDNNGNTSLSHFGLLGIEIDLKQQREFKKFNITHDELRSLCSIFALSMLADAAIKYYDAPLNDDNDKEDFTHNGVMYSYTLSDSTRKYNKAFLPTRTGMSNKRIDYVQRILKKKGFDVEISDAEKFLSAMWDRLLIEDKILLRDEDAYKINAKKIMIYNPEKWFVCKKCQKLTCHNIENVCPSYKCDGELKEINPVMYFADDHYYKLYNELEIRDLRIVEHTAQLNRDEAYNYQKQFKQKEIDVLSCSTTFEMGVDVGSLETVFMRNMPPMPANYAQRAGRAGRSKLSAAYALTFCNKSSHDFSFFRDPTSMIKGKIDPPRYSVNNDRIAIRHLYAATLSFFWRIHPEYFSTIGNFLKENEQKISGYKCLCSYLKSEPSELKNYLHAFLPSGLSKEFGVENFEWVDSLIGKNGVLTEAIETYIYEYSTLDDLKNKWFTENKNVGGIQQRLRAYSTENILTFLSRKNVLPKYGFPVDTVEMTINPDKKGQTYGLQLQRDLSMAISEYAPGSQIVANNKLITSRYINKIPSIGWKMYSYIKCENCNTLNIKPYTETEDQTDVIAECCQCKMPFTKSTKVFLVPAQGFAADGNSIRKPGLKKPEKTYRGEISYVGFNNDIENKHYDIGNAVVEVKTSHNDEMAVLNESNFFVCEKCGFAEVDDDCYVRYKQKTHKAGNGYNCNNKKLRRFSLGYRFLTDVVRISFDNYEITNFDQGLSILYGLLRGICRYLNIEESDISGCLQSYLKNNRLNYSIVIFDNTPGGSGHAKRLDNPEVLKGVMQTTLRLMSGCVCGGANGDSSCYSCIRNFRNQKYHDKLKRNYIIDFFNEIFSVE